MIFPVTTQDNQQNTERNSVTNKNKSKDKAEKKEKDSQDSNDNQHQSEVEKYSTFKKHYIKPNTVDISISGIVQNTPSVKHEYIDGISTVKKAKSEFTDNKDDSLIILDDMNPKSFTIVEEENEDDAEVTEAIDAKQKQKNTLLNIQSREIRAGTVS